MRLITISLICLGLMLTQVERLSASKFPVGSKQNPGKSCKDILAQGGKVTGTYYITLAGEPLNVYCDQSTAGGGWTLVYSYTFKDYKHFKGNGANRVVPRPTWPGQEHSSNIIPPLSETNYTAMDFKLWKQIGSEFIIKSNINNWFSCSEGTGSLVHWRKGSVNCKLLKSLTGKCSNVVPDSINGNFYGLEGLTLYDSTIIGVMPSVVYYLKTSHRKTGFPIHDPCGQYAHHPVIANVANPHGNIYIR